MDSPASHFSLQAMGPFLHWMTLGVLCVAPILIAFVIYKLGSLPGAIARSRRHPQADAINICGWMGIITLVLWPVALVWAHLVPGRSIGNTEPSASEDTSAVLASLQQASRRLAAIEGALPQNRAGG